MPRIRKSLRGKLPKKRFRRNRVRSTAPRCKWVWDKILRRSGPKLRLISSKKLILS